MTPSQIDAFVDRIGPICLGNPAAVRILCELPEELLVVIERSTLRGADIYKEYQRQGGWDGFLLWLAMEKLSQGMSPL